MTRQFSPKEEVLAYHRASPTNAPMFADDLVGKSSITSVEMLRQIYQELVKSSDMQVAGEAKTRDPRTGEITGLVTVYRLVKK